VLVVALALAMVYMEVQFNYWNRDFYNTFEKKDQAEFFYQLGKFGVLAFAWIIMAVYRLWFLQMLQIEWRTWLTHLLEEWMQDQAHYRIQLLDRGTDNPDQRIADDLHIFVDYTSDLALGLLSAVVTLISFVVILWGLSGSVQFWGFNIPGYLVWTALIYAIVGSVLTHYVGRRLIPLNFLQQRVEADSPLVRLRENSEVASTGARARAGGLRNRFAAVIANWWQLMRKRKQLNWFQSFTRSSRSSSPISWSLRASFPAASPGAIFQTASAFGQVQGSLSGSSMRTLTPPEGDRRPPDRLPRSIEACTRRSGADTR
jgi:putative ATP-binding cassette transporter